MTVPRPSVLLIDDDPLVRRALVRVLQRVAVVADVDSAEAALAVLGTGTVFDAIVADVSLGGRSGIELFEALREGDPRLAARFIAISGSDPRDLDEDFRSAIGNRVLVKPLGSGELEQIVLAVAGSSDVAAE